MKTFTLTSPRLRIPNPWIRDIISEIFATYIFVLFAIAVVAQEVLTGVNASTGMVINLSVSIALTMAIYVGGNASGAFVNPGIALSMCLTGYLEWKKYPVYLMCYFVGAFLAASTVYAVYHDDIDFLDGGDRLINSTGIIFSSFPSNPNLTTGAGFLEVMIAHGLLVLCTLAILDQRNMAPSLGLSPIPIGLSVFSICTGFSKNTACPINSTKDFAPRFMMLAAGYGTEAFSYKNYWFWVSPVATTIGSLLATVLYQLIVGVQWEPLKEDELTTDDVLDALEMESSTNHAFNHDEETGKKSIQEGKANGGTYRQMSEDEAK
ncbi:aquaporin-10-like [Liolophura sinensis]|uniref:aquaporin-10-like n=1 Tax=Liolophura sinensis TaxID=3198878 RepID=UPI0031580679